MARSDQQPVISKLAALLSVISHIYRADTEKAMAIHSSTLAWKIPWTEEPGRLQSMMGGGVVTEGWMRLSDFTFTFHFHTLEKEMATHSSVLAWIVAAQLSSSGDFHPECHLRYRMGK